VGKGTEAGSAALITIYQIPKVLIYHLRILRRARVLLAYTFEKQEVFILTYQRYIKYFLP
jgi:hypothetical protein